MMYICPTLAMVVLWVRLPHTLVPHLLTHPGLKITLLRRVLHSGAAVDVGSQLACSLSSCTASCKQAYLLSTLPSHSETTPQLDGLRCLASHPGA